MRQYLLDVISGKRDRFRDRIVLLLLSLLEVVYFIIIMIRNLLYKIRILKTKEPGCKVISVGNITTGGTGKTPVVERLAQTLKDRDKKIVVISRGYGSDNKKPLVVSDGKDIKVGVEQAGDEVFMLARHLENVAVVTGKDRYQAAKLAVERFDPELIVLDDGFQHQRLARDLEIVTIDARQPFGFNHLLPRGLLREPLFALKRADMFVISRTDQVSEEKIREIKEKIRKYNQTAEIYSSCHHPVYLQSLTSDQGDIFSVDWLKGKKVLALSGIGNPGSFLQSLQKLEAQVVDSITYPDHYQYQEQDLMEIAVQAQLKNADWVVTTEKDAVKFSEDMFGRFRRLEVGVCTLGIELKVNENNRFVDALFF